MLSLIHTCAIARNQTVGTNGRRGLQTVSTSTACLATPLNAATAIANRFDIGKGYEFFFEPGTDVRVKDRLTYSGDDYTVSTVQQYDAPIVGHVHVLAQREVGS